MNFHNIFKNALNMAKNTLEYTLFLPETSIITDENDETWVEACLLKSYQDCYCHMLDNFNTMNFFGSSYTNIVLQLERTAYITEPNLKDVLKKDFFGGTVLSQCVMAAYDSAMRLLTYGQYVTSYSLCKTDRKGFNELYRKKDYIDIPFRFKELTKLQSAGDSSMAAALTGKLSDCRSLLQEEGFKTGPVFREKKIDYFMADIYLNFASINKRKFASFLKLFNQTENANPRAAVRQWETVGAFMESNIYNIDPSSKINTESITDMIYCRYKTERIFHLQTAIYTFRLIEQLKHHGKIFPQNYKDFNFIVDICSLPNIFSRDIYLKYAFETADSGYDLFNDYFSKLQNPESAMKYFEKRPFDMNQWYINFKKFCRLFSKLIFPAMEWYFFISLNNTVCYHLKKANVKPTKDNINLKLQQVLSAYIQKHADYIYNPFEAYQPELIGKPIQKEWEEFCKTESLNSYTARKVASSYKNTKEAEKTINEFSIANLLTKYKNSSLYFGMPIKELNTDTFFAKTKNELAKHKIISTYISAVSIETIADGQPGNP